MKVMNIYDTLGFSMGQPTLTVNYNANRTLHYWLEWVAKKPHSQYDFSS